MITIYLGNKPVFLTDQLEEKLQQRMRTRDVLYMDSFSNEAVGAMIQRLEKGKAESGIFLHDDVAALLNAFKRHFTVIQAAGGLVYTNARQVLLIFRLGKWDLPKGKLDEGESLTDCAAREIEEETGVGALQLQATLPVTYHTYRQNGKHILKESHWFLFHTTGTQPLVPQTEEDIEKCEWVDADNLASYFQNTYPAVLNVLETGIAALQEKQA